MATLDIKDELQFLYSTLQSVGYREEYMLERVIMGAGKDYCCDDVHRWGRTEEGRVLYGKLKDLVRSRVMGMVESEKIDRGTALELCRGFGEIEYGESDGYVLSEADRRMLERAGVLVD